MNRAILTIMVMTLAVTVTSCIGCGNRESLTNRISTIVEEAEKIAQEEREVSTMSDRIFRITGDDLYDGDRAISIEEWDKIEALLNDMTDLTSEGASNLTKEAVEEIFGKHGYESFNDGKAAIQKVAELSEKSMTLIMGIQSVQASRMMGSTEEAEEEAEKLKKRITDNWKFTKEDVIAIEEKTDVIGKAVGIITILSFM